MSMFDTSTTPDESPVQAGQEGAGAEEQQISEGPDNQQQAAPESQDDAKTTPSEKTEQGDEAEEEYIPLSNYNELRGAFTRKAQEAAELRRQLQQYQQQAPGQNSGQANTVNTEDLTTQFWDTFSKNPIGVIQQLVNMGVEAKTAPIFEQQFKAELNQNIGMLAKEYDQLNTPDGMIALAGKVQEIAEELGNPSLAQRPTQRILKMAAQEAFGDSKTKLYQTAKAKGKQEALETIKTKQGITETTGKKAQEQPKSIEEQIADSIVSAGRRGGVFG